MNPTVCTSRYASLSGTCVILAALFCGAPLIQAGSPPEPQAAPADHAVQDHKDPERDRIVSRLQDTYQKIQSYRTDFSQESASKVLHTTRKSEGYLMIKKPGRMRWIYQNPRPQEVILQPDRIYIYLPQENQVLTKSVEEYLTGITPTRFLMGVGNLMEDFTILLVSGPDENKDAYHLRLVPKEQQGQLKELQIWVRKKDFLVEQTQSVDFLENETRIRFSSQEINPDLPDSLFFFTIPKDAEVLKDSF